MKNLNFFSYKNKLCVVKAQAQINHTNVVLKMCRNVAENSLWVCEELFSLMHFTSQKLQGGTFFLQKWIFFQVLKSFNFTLNEESASEWKSFYTIFLLPFQILSPIDNRLWYLPARNFEFLNRRKKIHARKQRLQCAKLLRCAVQVPFGSSLPPFRWSNRICIVVLSYFHPSYVFFWYFER